MKVMEIIQRMTLARSILIGLSLAAFYYFVMFDNGSTQLANIAAAEGKIQELQKQLVENQAKIDRAAVYTKSVAELGTTIQKLLSVIPEKFGTSDLMKIVSNEAKVAGSSLVSITPGKTNEFLLAREFEELNVGIEMTGSFLQHMVFLSNLTKINQIMIIRKMDLSTQGGAGKAEDATNVRLSADIVAYRYKGVPPATAAGEPPGAPPSEGSNSQ